MKNYNPIHKNTDATNVATGDTIKLPNGGSGVIQSIETINHIVKVPATVTFLMCRVASGPNKGTLINIPCVEGFEITQIISPEEQYEIDKAAKQARWETFKSFFKRAPRQDEKTLSSNTPTFAQSSEFPYEQESTPAPQMFRPLSNYPKEHTTYPPIVAPSHITSKEHAKYPLIVPFNGLFSHLDNS